MLVMMGLVFAIAIPKFKSMYSSFHAQLPPFTLAVFGVSDFLIHYIAFIVGGIVFTVFYINNVLRKSKRGRYAFDAFVLKIPLFGPILKRPV